MNAFGQRQRNTSSHASASPAWSARKFTSRGCRNLPLRAREAFPPSKAQAVLLRACNRYYGLIRQSDELRPAWSATGAPVVSSTPDQGLEFAVAAQPRAAGSAPTACSARPVPNAAAGKQRNRQPTSLAP